MGYLYFRTHLNDKPMDRKQGIKLMLPLLRNKYVITFLVFVVWLGFFDQNNLVDRLALSRRISDLEDQKEHYQTEIEENENRLKELQSDPENLEKFAREQYLMKKADEEIFVVVEE